MGGYDGMTIPPYEIALKFLELHYIERAELIQNLLRIW